MLPCRATGVPLASIANVTFIFPLPDWPDTMEIQGELLVDVQLQVTPLVTVAEVVAAIGASVKLAGETENCAG